MRAIPPRLARLALSLLLAACLALLGKAEAQADTLVPAGSVWRYLDDGSDQGTTWHQVAFDDSGWVSGGAQLGYGDGDEATVVRYGPNANDKFVTTYFRLAFPVADQTVFSDLTLSLLRDDGAVVYLNGREVFRSNMPSGSLTYRTSALANVSGAAESTFYPTTIVATNLVNGTNLLAVEVHQCGTNSTDISFDLELVGHRPPITVMLNAPAAGATEVSTSPALSVSLPDVTRGPVTVTFHGRLAGPPPGPDFTLVALPDTQCYVASLNGGRPSHFTAQTDWIVANQAARNIAFVTQLGDLTENGDRNATDAEWLWATNALYRLEQPGFGIPYGVAVGNHDQKASTNGLPCTSYYNQFFGVDHFAGRDYVGGHFGVQNNNHYELFSASGLDFITIHLEYGVNSNVLNWASGLLQTHASRRAIVISHYLLEIGHPANFGGSGRAVYEALKGYPNLFLMLCGHVPGEGRRQDTFNDHTLHTLMSDYQGRTNGGSGWLRLLEFSPSNHVIRVKTYTPVFDQYDTNASSQFTLDYDMRRGDAFTPLATFTEVTGPTNLTLAWTGLAEHTAYEWCVTVSDGTCTTTSPIWQFTTGSNLPPVVAVTRVREVPGSPGFLPSVTLAIDATATDSDGVIETVEFFANATPLGASAASPFTCTWRHVPVGNYQLTAVAQDSQGLRATSAPVAITVSLDGDSGSSVRAPDGLQATAVSGSQVALQWKDNSTNEEAFVVERSTNGVDFLEIAVLAADTTTYLDSELTASTRYVYRTYAFSASSASSYSSPASAITPGAATNPFRLNVDVDRARQTVRLSWPATPGTVYRVVTKNNITDTGWTDWSEEITATGSTVAWSEPVSPSVATRFYGVRIVR